MRKGQPLQQIVMRKLDNHRQKIESDPYVTPPTKLTQNGLKT